MLLEVAAALFQSREIFFRKRILRHAAVQLQRLDGGNENGEAGGKTRKAALDIEELFRAEVGAEACLCYHIIREL